MTLIGMGAITSHSLHQAPQELAHRSITTMIVVKNQLVQFIVIQVYIPSQACPMPDRVRFSLSTRFTTTTVSVSSAGFSALFGSPPKTMRLVLGI
jgi:hypothetical protein